MCFTGVLSVCFPQFSFLRSFGVSWGQQPFIFHSLPAQERGLCAPSGSCWGRAGFWRVDVLIREMDCSACGKCSVKCCCHFGYVLCKVKAIPLFLLHIALVILKVVTSYCFGFDCNVISPFKIPWVLFTSGLLVLILMCRASYCPLRRGNESM